MCPDTPRDVETELDPLGNNDEGSRGAFRTYLVVRAPNGVFVQEVEQGTPVTFGRSPDATVVLDTQKASRQHAIVRREGSALLIEDLGSRNGTRVGGTRVQGTQRLASGDVIQIAGYEAVVAVSCPAQAPDVDSTTPSERAEPRQARAVVVADRAMRATYELAGKLASVDADVLILGETGVGKEVMAREIHDRSGRASGPFVRVNCPSLPETLVESELFGHERGAFTGADRARPGLFEAAQGGTLLLDEIGDLPASMQVKLLGVIENRAVRRVGGIREIAVDVRILCATHRDLVQEISAGRFREDLYFRISAFTLTIPPLRERPTEVLLLSSLFARQWSARLRTREPDISPRAASLLQRYPWPGNVRELRNAIQHAVVLASGSVIEPEHLPASVRGAERADSVNAQSSPMRGKVEQVEREAIEAALSAEGGNQTRAAKRLGISRRALIYKMQKYRLK